MDYRWKCLKIDREVKKKLFNYENCTFDHPLKSKEIMMIDSKGTRNKLTTNSSNSSSKSNLSLDPLNLDGVSDPLSQFARQEIDPLSQMAAEYDSILPSNNNKYKKRVKAIDTVDTSAVEPWITRRGTILNKYTTSEKLTIFTSFLNTGQIIRTQTTVDKVRHRLEQLDEFQDVHQMNDLSQQEYVTKIQQLNSELVDAWRTDQRVKSLKIAIQCSKLLTDTSVVQFYPSKFVLITDILDIFGKLVYDRLKAKSESIESNTRSTLPENFTSDMVPETAKETCLNWFYKIASIRELLPRLYVEMSLIKCYNFINSWEYEIAVNRIAKMIRGIGDPLVAAYARCYLVRVGITVCNDKQYMKDSFMDFLGIYHTIFNTGIRAELSKQKLDLSCYLSLYNPALEFMVQHLTSNSSDIFLEELLNCCKERKNNSLLLLTILQTYRPEFVAVHAFEFVTVLSDTQIDGITRGSLFRLLGNILGINPPPPEQRLMILNNAWQTINTLTNVADYVSCVEMWTKFVAINFDLKIVNKFLGDILMHVTPKRAFEKHYVELQGIVDKIITFTKDFEGLLGLDNFLPVVDLFQKESVRLEVSKNILLKYKSSCAAEEDEAVNVFINDPVTINAFNCIAKVLNDAVNALTTDDERRQIGNLISFFIRKVNYGRDFEQQLSFYVDARGMFPNLDNVLQTLVNCVNKLSMDTRKIVKGNHTRKTAAFVKACSAYCFITIPTILSTIHRMDLYLLSGQVALVNLCLGQADACFEAAIHLIPELPKYVEIDGKQRNTETHLQSYVQKFLSILIVVPDSPEQGVLYLLRTLIENVKQYDFDPNGTTLAIIYVYILDTLSSCAQDVYPYHLQHVVSNDQLYGSDPKFINEINEICSQIVEELLEMLKELADRPIVQCTVALELFTRVATMSDLTDDKLFILAVNLWNLVVKNRKSIDQKTLTKTLQHLESIKSATKSNTYVKRLEDLLIKIRSKL